MMKNRVVALITIIGTLAIGSCIFQNDPLKPNSPPVIEFSDPSWRYHAFVAPDSCLFSIRAVDADGDMVDYRFVIGDSVLGTSDKIMFFATDSGYYHLQAYAMDGSAHATRSWIFTVDEEYNEPPFIIGFLPPQREISCTVGETLVFTFSVIDDKMESLQYTFELTKIGETGTRRYYGSQTLEYRFLERGDFKLKGMVWDGQYGDTTHWNVGVTGYPDTIAPAAIIDLEGRTGDNLGSVWITWTATGDDGATGTASSYEVRTSTEPILTEEDWTEASRKNGTPDPAPAGTRESMVVRALNPGTYVYVTMRAIDDFFNYSPIGNCIHLLVRGIDASGYVRNMLDGEPIGGIMVVSHTQYATTNAAGAYLLKNLPYYVSHIRVTDDDVFGYTGDYYDCFHIVYNPEPSISQNFWVMPVLDLVNIENPKSYGGKFIQFFKEVTETSGRFNKPTIYRGWDHWPLTVYNPEKTYQDIDLQAAARGAMDEWEAMTGLDLFIEVDYQSGANVRIVYNDTLDQKHHYETVAWNPDGTPKTRSVYIFPSNTSVSVTRFAHLVYAHELGHVLGFLVHSNDPGHIMLGLTRPPEEHVTIDEARVIQILYHAPYIFDYGTVIEE
jgi:hypothetical protein